MEQQPAGGAMSTPGAPINVPSIKTETPQKSVASISPRVLVCNTMQQRPGPAPMPPQMQAMPGSSQGHVFLKTESVQFDLTLVGQGASPSPASWPYNLPASMLDVQPPSQSTQQHLPQQAVISARDVFVLTPQHLQRQHLQRQHLQQQHLQQQHLQQQHLQQQNLQQQHLEQHHLERQNLQQQHLQQQHLQQQNLQQQHLEQHHLERQNFQQQHLQQQHLQQQHLQQQNLQQQHLEQHHLERQNLQQHHLEQRLLQQQNLEQHLNNLQQQSQMPQQSFQQQLQMQHISPTGHMQQFLQHPQMSHEQLSSGSQPGPSQSAHHVKPLVNTKEKCRNFLANLLELSSNEPTSVERNVRALIQDLIDDTVEANEFCFRLELLLNAKPQPSLIGFLKKSVPLLRQSLAACELTIEGIKPPEMHVVFPPSVPQFLPSLPCNVALPIADTSTHGGVTIMKDIPVYTKPLGKAAVASGSGSGSGKSMTINKHVHALRGQHPLTGLPTGMSLHKEKERKPSLFPGAFSDDKMAGDDDINDVAAMGGVNLLEESRRIFGNNDMIGSQIRSCKEEHVAESGLRARVRSICQARELLEPVPELTQLLSQALEQRMRSLIERLAGLALHRQETEFKALAQYEVLQDVRAQLRFLEEVDRAEARRREEAERELLLRAAKSRSKSEDPEQAKLKAKAKEMQRAEMEEVRQREANLTALQAIGPRKKPRLEPAVPTQSAAGEPLDAQPPTRAPPRPRPLRVTMRDMLHLLENDRYYARSHILYKAYLKS